MYMVSVALTEATGAFKGLSARFFRVWKSEPSGSMEAVDVATEVERVEVVSRTVALRLSVGR